MPDTDRDFLDKEIVALTPVVRRVIRARVAEPNMAEELVQETLTRLLEARPHLPTTGSPVMRSSRLATFHS